MSLFEYNSNELRASERMQELRSSAQTRRAARVQSAASAASKSRWLRLTKRSRQTTGKSGSSISAPSAMTPRSSSNGGDVTQSLGACVASPAR